MDPIEEIKFLLKGLNILKNKWPEVMEKNSTTEILEHYQKVANLSMCLESACWRVFGDRQTDDLRHLLDKK